MASLLACPHLLSVQCFNKPMGPDPDLELINISLTLSCVLLCCHPFSCPDSRDMVSCQPRDLCAVLYCILVSVWLHCDVPSCTCTGALTSRRCQEPFFSPCSDSCGFALSFVTERPHFLTPLEAASYVSGAFWQQLLIHPGPPAVSCLSFSEAV